MKRGALGNFIDEENTYRIYLPVDDSLDSEMHRELVSKFFHLIHRLYLNVKLILKIDGNGCSFYVSFPSDPKLLKTVYRNLTDVINITKTKIDIGQPDLIYSSFQTNKKYFLGPEGNFVDFFEYVLSYKNRIHGSSLFVILDIGGTNVPFRIDYRGLVFKLRINILVFGNLPELDNFISLVSNYWSNSDCSLKFKKINSLNKLKRGSGLLCDRNIDLVMPFPGKFWRMLELL